MTHARYLFKIRVPQVHKVLTIDPDHHDGRDKELGGQEPEHMSDTRALNNRCRDQWTNPGRGYVGLSMYRDDGEIGGALDEGLFSEVRRQLSFTQSEKKNHTISKSAYNSFSCPKGMN